jgi:hypothetical protein
MTAVGKILVFLNLVFSLVVGAFVIMIYLARTHWVDEYNKLAAQTKVLSASEQTWKKEADDAKQGADAKVQKAQADLKNVQADLQAEVALNTQIKKDLEDLKKKSTQQNAVASLSMVEVQKRQEDVAKLRETLKKETDLNVALVKKNNELTDQTTAALIEKRSVQEQNNRLEAQLQQLARDMARLKAGGGATTVRAGGKNPPPESVEGLVKTTDPSGLMTLTIGTDAGLTKGHTLELFRLNPSSPTQSKYLGTVRILESTATQAVAQPMGRLSSPAQPGDRVASRILGS